MSTDRRDRRGAKRPRRRARRWLVALALVVVIVGAAGAVQVSHDIDPPGHPGRTVTVSIPKGTPTPKIAALLAKAGVIHGPEVFELYLKIRGGGPVIAGTYPLRTNEPYGPVISELEAGPLVLAKKLVVPEGFTISKMATAVAKLQVGITAREFVAAATSGRVRSMYEPAGTGTLEGLLFPATYPVTAGESADALVRYMVRTFDYEASRIGLRAAARRLHRSAYQVVTVASIVEREAKFSYDMGPIASAIYNRLALGMPIGAESTLLYGLGDPKGPVDITQPNPYNTLVNKGLPPTPISSPGVASLEAAMHPPKTTYLYWVEVDPDGKMGFGTTPAQFKQLQRDCRAARLC